MAKWLLPSGYFGPYFGSGGAPTGYISGGTTLEFFLDGTLSEGPTSFIFGNIDAAVTLSGFLTAMDYRYLIRQDAYAGPVKPLGVVGRLALDRNIVEDHQEIIIVLRGLRSETITIAGESASGVIVGYPVIRHLKSGAIVTDSVLQNGVFVIRVDDLKPVWDNLVFIKSGNDDRVLVQIESPFDYVERPMARRTPTRLMQP